MQVSIDKDGNRKISLNVTEKRAIERTLGILSVVNDNAISYPGSMKEIENSMAALATVMEYLDPTEVVVSE